MILIGEGELGVLGKATRQKEEERERGSWWELPRLGAQGPGVLRAPKSAGSQWGPKSPRKGSCFTSPAGPARLCH